MGGLREHASQLAVLVVVRQIAAGEDPLEAVGWHTEVRLLEDARRGHVLHPLLHSCGSVGRMNSVCSWGRLDSVSAMRNDSWPTAHEDRPGGGPKLEGRGQYSRLPHRRIAPLRSMAETADDCETGVQPHPSVRR